MNNQMPKIPKQAAYGVKSKFGFDPLDGHKQLIGLSVGKPNAVFGDVVELFTKDQMLEYAQAARASQAQQPTREQTEDDVKFSTRAAWTFKDWWEHVGAWKTDRHTLEFGSVIAFGMMMQQFAACLKWTLTNQLEQEPLLTLILGGIEGDEYSENDVEWHTKAVEALQDKLVRGSEPVFVPLYRYPQARKPAFPPRDLTKPAEQQGMFSKFHVERVDGSSAKGGKHHGCRYWVLDLDHDKHAPAAMRGYAEDCKETHPVLSAEIFTEFGMQSQVQQPSIEDQRAKLVVNMVKYLGATKTQAKAIVDGVFDGENTVKELFLFQDLPNTLAGFLGGCAGSGVTPTQQMIYDAGVKSGMNRIQSQAQQTESKWINLKKDDYSHLKGNELIYAYGIGCGIFEAYLKDYEVVREDMFNRNTSEVTHIMVRIPVPLPPAPEGDRKP